MKLTINYDRQRQLKIINHGNMPIDRGRKRLNIKNEYKIVTNEISEIKQKIKDLETIRDKIYNELKNT